MTRPSERPSVASSVNASTNASTNTSARAPTGGTPEKANEKTSWPVRLPRTSFEMRANLPQKETSWIRLWNETKLWQRLRRQSEGRPVFVLHDGPPYANGHLHIGHAVNKILKDIVNKTQQMAGYDAHYVPGWDCHGLPIEWKIEETYRQKGRNKDEVPALDFREECRRFAQDWVGIQSREFQRMGVLGAWEDPYLTMTPQAEGAIAAEMGSFLLSGALYRKARPVLWSIAEKTALAEAEIEYQEVKSITIHVRFPVRYVPPGLPPELQERTGVVIWTTTPWTLPGNRAIACGSSTRYVHVELTAPGGRSLAVGDRLLVAEERLESLREACGLASVRQLGVYTGADLEGLRCAHPWAESGYAFEVPLACASFVESDQGTGFVHVAPGHGPDDFALGEKIGLENPPTLDEEGRFLPHLPLVAGLEVYQQDGSIGRGTLACVRALAETTPHLLAKGSLRHAYPHSWRSKIPLLFRNTPQWFIPMAKLPAPPGETSGKTSGPGLREQALEALEAVRFFPPAGGDRLRAMIRDRPDWCVSRQRSWGVPLPVFYHRETGEPLRSPELMKRISDIFSKEGSDAWYKPNAKQRFLQGLVADEAMGSLIQSTDVVDVWFDSGSSHAFVLDRRKLPWPADLYLEGSDQHRGWFHSSLLEAVGTRGRAPYKAVLTHGFALDGRGRKMSKSLGNIVTPETIIQRYGADILRIWVVAADYQEDIRIGEEILATHVDAYRSLRNTLRFLLGNMSHFDPAQAVQTYEAFPPLERYICHRLRELHQRLEHHRAQHAYTRIFREILTFATVELSSFYFDIRKDVLYCDGDDSVAYRACQTVLGALFRSLCTWLAPILSFTCEEAWEAFPHRDPEKPSIHEQSFFEPPAPWFQADVAANWRQNILPLRKKVMALMEEKRRDKIIGPARESEIRIQSPEVKTGVKTGETLFGLSAPQWAELCLTAEALLCQGQTDTGDSIALESQSVQGKKCQRCWRVLSELADSSAELCLRCREVVETASIEPTSPTSPGPPPR